MYKYKIHCSVRGSVKTQIVYVEVEQANKTNVISKILKLYPTLKPLKIYFVGEVKKKVSIPIESEKPKKKKKSEPKEEPENKEVD